MNENPTINFALALKNNGRNGKGRSMRNFCEDGMTTARSFNIPDMDKKSTASSRRQMSVSVCPEVSHQNPVRKAGVA